MVHVLEIVTIMLSSLMVTSSMSIWIILILITIVILTLSHLFLSALHKLQFVLVGLYTGHGILKHEDETTTLLIILVVLSTPYFVLPDGMGGRCSIRAYEPSLSLSVQGGSSVMVLSCTCSQILPT